MRKTHLIREGAYAYCGAWAIIGQDVTDWHTFHHYPIHLRCGSCLRIYLSCHCLPPTPEPKGNPPCAPSKRSPTASNK